MIYAEESETDGVGGGGGEVYGVGRPGWTGSGGWDEACCPAENAG